MSAMRKARWFEEHAFGSVTTPEFVDFLRRELLDRYPGRIKLVRPPYEDLLETPDGAAFARRVYALARPGYHPITQHAVDREMPTGVP